MAWKRTINRMNRYANERISETEADKIAEYLVSIGKPKKPASQEISKKEIKGLGDQKLSEFKKVRVNQFIDPSVCSRCHSEKFKQWNGSMHSKAFYDPLWRKATKLFFKEAKSKDEVLEMKACVKCHTPLGFRSYLISSPDDDYDKLAHLPAQGIFCNSQ